MSKDKGVKLRNASARDLPFIISLSEKVFKIYGPYGRILAISFFDSRVKTLVALEGGRRVGFVMITRRTDSLRHGLWGEISAIAVDPGCHGRGIGRVLLREAISFAKRNSFAYVVLHTAQQNQRARALFERFGFRVRRKVGDYYPEGQPAYEMVRILSESVRQDEDQLYPLEREDFPWFGFPGD